MVRRACWLVLGLALLTACGAGRRPGDDEGDDPGGGGAASPVPEGMVGQWESVLTYVPAYWEGVIPTADFIGSIGVFFYFWPDGRYEFDLSSAMTYFNGNCFRNTGWTEFGTVEIDGSACTFRPAEATSTVMDSCGEASFTTPDPGDPVTHTMTPEQDPAGWPVLRWVLPSGEELLLEKCRDCG